MIRCSKLFLYLSVLVLFFSCEVPAGQYNNTNSQQDTIAITTAITDSILKSMSDSIKIDSIQIIKVVFTDTTDYSKLKEEYKRASKIKIRTFKIHSLKDSVSSISFKLDNIGERLKMCKLSK